ncbi:MAG: thioredoxin domain-containing protein [bacterium]|nr:MAG: thioredoxin domain-containing protein [bacterium]
MLEKHKGKVKVVFKNFPIRNHRFARPAAEAALAADIQGKFWPFHDRLFENYNRIDEDLILGIARDLELDMDRFGKDRRGPRVAAIINRDMAEAGRVGVRGTPTIFVNGKPLTQRSLESFSAAIERELDPR